MKRSAAWVSGIRATAAVAATAALALTLAGERDAAACGGCFHPPTQTATDITDERMLLAVSQQQSTLYDQIQYQGSPSSFAWVLPIHGNVDVGLSADVLFDSISALTDTTINPPPLPCPAAPSNCPTNAIFGGSASAGAAADGPGSVTITKQQNVGPYATVQLHSTDPTALNAWLTTNGYAVTDDVQQVITAYVNEGFDFLAMKLLPDQGIQSMRPVRVTFPGMSVSLPLRMAAVGTGNIVGITIWVVSDGRYEPQNFPFFHIEDTDLVWDFTAGSSNYTTLRANDEAALKNAGWEIESSITLNQALITNVVLSGGNYFPSSNGIGGIGYVGGPSDPSQDYLPILATSDDGGAPASTGDAGDAGDAGSAGDGGNGDDGGNAGVLESAEDVRADDIAALFAGLSGSTVRVTRMRGDIAHAAMTTDLVLKASDDQSEVSNIRTVTNSINAQCSIYNQCSVVGTGTPAQAAASVGQTEAMGSSVNGGGGCAAAPSNGRTATGIGAVLGVVGFGLLRTFRRRRSARKA